MVGGIAPLAGIAVLGFASWQRSWRIALLGLVTSFGPLFVLFLWHFL